MVLDLRALLLGTDANGNVQDVPEADVDVMHLWDEKNGFAKSYTAYGKDLDAEQETDEADEIGYGTTIQDT
jgi:hypothetical protein